jgi:nucleotide-binding universal stress UspA family protein
VTDERSPHVTHQHPDDWEEPVEIPDVPRDFQRVLLPFDGSAGSERGLAYAEIVAQITNAEIVVVVAYDPPLTVRRRGILLVEQARAELEQDATELAQEAVQLLLDRGNQARAIVVRGDPAQSILETIDVEQADVVVLGRRGLNRFEGLALGSVSLRVSTNATIPVFLV